MSLSNFKGSKYLRCPSCGKTRIKPYAYEDGTIESEVLGRCQREGNCGYHLKPAEYFKDKEGSFRNTPTFSQHKQLETYTINTDLARKFSSNYRNSTLFQHLQKTGLDFSQTFEKYFVGSTRDGSTIFFQYDGVKFRAGKIIKYVNGHRDKSSGLPCTWFHKKMKDLNEETHELRQCFFGRHLINESETICIVESEKTALICATIFGGVWLATGGRTQNLTNLSELSKKRVIIFPDDDSVEYWQTKIKTFQNCELYDLSRFNILQKKGADLADLLMEMGEEVKRSVYLYVVNIF